jgi:hypothetical protein
MADPTQDWLIQIDIAIPDFEIVTTLRIRADPGFVIDSCTLAAKIRQRHKVAKFAL